MTRQIRRNGELVAGVEYNVVVTTEERSRLQMAADRARLSKGELLAKMLKLWEREELARAGAPLFERMGGNHS